MNKSMRAGLLIPAVVVAAMAAEEASKDRASSGPAKPPASRPATAPAGARQITLDAGSGIRVKLAFIPPGRFMMGSHRGQKISERDERPQREVVITKGFYLGTTEVTRAQYHAVMGGEAPDAKRASLPVDRVSWDDAVGFCKRLAATTGRSVRLPTEAEWEYACRAGTKTLWTFGDDEKALDGYAWHKGNSDGATHPVARKKPNPWGLYDMYGNVCEWVFDYHGSYAKLPKTDPRAAKGNHRILRGGSWRNPASFCRSPNRAGAGPEAKRPNLGFRIVVEMKE